MNLRIHLAAGGSGLITALIIGMLCWYGPVWVGPVKMVLYVLFFWSASYLLGLFVSVWPVVDEVIKAKPSPQRSKP